MIAKKQPRHKGNAYIPARLQAIGLTEANTYPLVSPGKQANGRFRSFRMPAKKAWQFPSIELRSQTAWTVMIMDCDTHESIRILHESITSQTIPWPNWITQRKTGSKLHAVWIYRQPVLRGTSTRRKPQAYAAHINEYYRHHLNADPGYRGILTHNPMNVHYGKITTHWGTDEPYSLHDLARPIPKGWKKPETPTTGIGRNCSIFEACMKWAGSPINRNSEILPTAMALNSNTDDPQGPLPHSEVIGIAKSVERYRNQWDFIDTSTKAISQRQRERQKQGVKNRNEKNAKRNQQIAEAYKTGKTQSAIALEFNLSQQAISTIIRRMTNP